MPPSAELDLCRVLPFLFAFACAESSVASFGRDGLWSPPPSTVDPEADEEVDLLVDEDDDPPAAAAAFASDCGLEEAMLAVAVVVLVKLMPSLRLFFSFLIHERFPFESVKVVLMVVERVAGRRCARVVVKLGQEAR